MKIIEKEEQIRIKTEKFMHGLQENAEKVTRLFKHKKLKYIEEYDC